MDNRLIRLHKYFKKQIVMLFYKLSLKNAFGAYLLDILLIEFTL